jgi:(p)ppGpp synthase/HD superfamily hydrolase
MIPYQTSKDIEKAITFLVHAINTSGNNPKPVILHSILVGLSLAKLDHPIHVIQAGFLHDIIEDSSVNIESIKKQFGDKVADIIAACTYDRSIQDKTEQYKDATRRTAEAGKEALIVVAADLIQNEAYYNQEDFTDYPWDKITYFIGFAEPYLKDEPIWENLELIKQKIYEANKK